MRNIRIRIPSTLRRYAGGRSEVLARGATVGEALASLYGTYGAIMDWLADGKGGLNGLARVLLDGRDIRTLAGLASPVQGGEVLSIEYEARTAQSA